MVTILSGITARDASVQSLAHTISKLEQKPTLVIIQVGDRSDSNAYIKQKKTLAEKIGAIVIHKQFPESVTQAELMQSIKNFNLDTNVHGIILQIPIPAHLEKETLINAIDPMKDVDGLTATNTKCFLEGKPEALIPATARGVLSLCDFYSIPLKNKKITVIGKSALVGKPVALSLIHRGAIVTVCDKQTRDLIPYTKQADIIVVAAGAPGLITKDHVSSGQTIIDVGITVLEQEGKRKLVGDVAFSEVEPIVAAITPVPGGVGPMTVISLFENLLQAYQAQH